MQPLSVITGRYNYNFVDKYRAYLQWEKWAGYHFTWQIKIEHFCGEWQWEPYTESFVAFDI